MKITHDPTQQNDLRLGAISGTIVALANHIVPYLAWQDIRPYTVLVCDFIVPGLVFGVLLASIILPKNRFSIVARVAFVIVCTVAQGAAYETSYDIEKYLACDDDICGHYDPSYSWLSGLAGGLLGSLIVYVYLLFPTKKQFAAMTAFFDVVIVPSLLGGVVLQLATLATGPYLFWPAGSFATYIIFPAWQAYFGYALVSHATKTSPGESGSVLQRLWRRRPA